MLVCDVDCCYNFAIHIQLQRYHLNVHLLQKVYSSDLHREIAYGIYSFFKSEWAGTGGACSLDWMKCRSGGRRSRTAGRRVVNNATTDNYENWWKLVWSTLQRWLGMHFRLLCISGWNGPCGTSDCGGEAPEKISCQSTNQRSPTLMMAWFPHLNEW